MTLEASRISKVDSPLFHERKFNKFGISLGVPLSFAEYSQKEVITVPDNPHVFLARSLSLLTKNEDFIGFKKIPGSPLRNVMVMLGQVDIVAGLEDISLVFKGTKEKVGDTLDAYNSAVKALNLPHIDIMIYGVDQKDESDYRPTDFPIRQRNTPIIQSGTEAVLLDYPVKEGFSIGEGANIVFDSNWYGVSDWIKYWRWVGRRTLTPPIWATQPSFTGHTVGE